jgi:hypothetical protein
LRRVVIINIFKAFILIVIVILIVLFSTGQESKFIYTDF